MESFLGKSPVESGQVCGTGRCIAWSDSTFGHRAPAAPGFAFPKALVSHRGFQGLGIKGLISSRDGSL